MHDTYIHIQTSDDTALLREIARIAYSLFMRGEEDSVSIDTGIANIERLAHAMRDLAVQYGWNADGEGHDLALAAHAACEALLVVYAEHSGDPDGEATSRVVEAMGRCD